MAVTPPIGMMIILQSARDAMHFDRWQGPGEKSRNPLLSSCVNGADAPGIPSGSFGLEPKREEQDETVFEDDRGACLGDAGAGFCRDDNAGEYCRTDVTSHMQSCGFDTLEQCQNMSPAAAAAATAIRFWLPPAALTPIRQSPRIQNARRRLRSGRSRADEAKALLTLPATFEVGFKGRG